MDYLQIGRSLGPGRCLAVRAAKAAFTASMRRSSSVRTFTYILHGTGVLGEERLSLESGVWMPEVCVVLFEWMV